MYIALTGLFMRAGVICSYIKLLCLIGWNVYECCWSFFFWSSSINWRKFGTVKFNCCKHKYNNHKLFHLYVQFDLHYLNISYRRHCVISDLCLSRCAEMVHENAKRFFFGVFFFLNKEVKYLKLQYLQSNVQNN